MSKSIGESDFDRVEELVDSLGKEVRAQQEFFYQLGVTREDGAIRVSIVDNINAYSFHNDPAVEVYASEYGEPTIGELTAIAHGGGSDHSRVDASKHLNAMKPDKEMLTRGAIRLEPSRRVPVELLLFSVTHRLEIIGNLAVPRLLGRCRSAVRWKHGLRFLRGLYVYDHLRFLEIGLVTHYLSAWHRERDSSLCVLWFHSTILLTMHYLICIFRCIE